MPGATEMARESVQMAQGADCAVRRKETERLLVWEKRP